MLKNNCTPISIIGVQNLVFLSSINRNKINFILHISTFFAKILDFIFLIGYNDNVEIIYYTNR